MSKELRIKKGDVQLSIHFETVEELKEKLNDYESIWKVVQDKLGNVFEERRTVRKDLEGICDFVDNHVVFVKTPDSPVKKVCLVLHAYGPKGATLEEITLGSGVSNPSRNILNNSGYKKYFRKLSKDKYGLSDTGISFTIKEIVPELKGEQESIKT